VLGTCVSGQPDVAELAFEKAIRGLDVMPRVHRTRTRHPDTIPNCHQDSTCDQTLPCRSNRSLAARRNCFSRDGIRVDDRPTVGVSIRTPSTATGILSCAASYDMNS